MKLRIEKNDNALHSHFSPYSKMAFKSSSKHKTQDVLNYKTWRHTQSTKTMEKVFSKNKIHKNNNNGLRTLLGDMTQLRKYLNSTDRKSLKQKNNQSYDRDLLIRSIDCEEASHEPKCQIIIKHTPNQKIIHHKASTTQKLKTCLKAQFPKIQVWKTSPQNLALDFYLSLKQKDISFLNGQTLTLQPYKSQQQGTITLNSFDILHCIGTGGFSKVYLCRFKQDGKFYAMKVIDKQFIVKNKKKRIVMNQKKIMEQLKHPFIIEMKFAFESKSSLVFVLELCPGGELFGLVKKFRIMSQDIAKFYMIQILLGLEEIHKSGIVYRDFKPENILIDMEGHVRIADFGLAKPGISNSKDKAYSFCGSPEYMPPQMILKKGHSLPVDFYCLGALLYELVTGLPPFYSENPNQIYEGTISKSITFPGHAKISDQLKQLLKSLLCKQQSRRLGSYSGVKQVLAHPWFRKINKDLYIKKQLQAPVRFTGIKDLKLIFSQMQVKNQQYVKDILNQQKIELKKIYEPVMDKFYYDYRQRYSIRNSQKQNSFSTFSLSSQRQRNTSREIKQKNKSLKNFLSQRSYTGNCTIRPKPLSTRCLDINVFLR